MGAGAFGHWGLPQAGTLWGACVLPCTHSLEGSLDRHTGSTAEDSEGWAWFSAVGLVRLPPPPPAFVLAPSFCCSRLFMFKHVSSCVAASAERLESRRAPPRPPLQGLGLLCSRTALPGLRAPGERCVRGGGAVRLARPRLRLASAFCLLSLLAAPGSRGPAPSPAVPPGHFRSGIWAADTVFP